MALNVVSHNRHILEVDWSHHVSAHPCDTTLLGKKQVMCAVISAPYTITCFFFPLCVFLFWVPPYISCYLYNSWAVTCIEGGGVSNEAN